MTRKIQTIIPELNNAAIRRVPDGRCSVYDLIAVVAEQKKPTTVWMRIKSAHPEVATFCSYFKFPGRGQRETPVTDREGWLYILGLLPGVIGRKYRESAANLVIRYLDADVTLAEEIVERTDDDDGLERLEARLKGKKIRKEHTRVLRSRGVATGLQFAICTNKTYAGLYGTNAQGLRKRKELGNGDNVREHMNTDELVEVAFAESVSTRKIRKGTAEGVKECGSINYRTAKGVAEFIRTSLEG